MAAKRTFKAKRTMTGGRTEYRGWATWDEDDKITCKLVGTSKNKMSGREDWVVEVIEADFADAREAKRVTGKRLTLNSAGMIDKALEQLEMGSFCEITYDGSGKMEGGTYKGKSAHKMTVVELTEDGDEVDDEEEDEDDIEDTEEDGDDEDDEDLL